MREQPGIVFRDGPTGRRPGLARGLDVWEVVDAVRHIKGQGNLSVTDLADQLGLSQRDLGVALDYYANHRDEIDQWIDENDRVLDEAERRSRAKRSNLV